MKIKALVGAAALAALVASGAAVAYAQDNGGGQAPGTMAPIPNPPEKPKAAHHHGKHMKKHAVHHAAKHHKAAKPAKGDDHPKTDAK